MLDKHLTTVTIKCTRQERELMEQNARLVNKPLNEFLKEKTTDCPLCHGKKEYTAETIAALEESRTQTGKGMTLEQFWEDLGIPMPC